MAVLLVADHNNTALGASTAKAMAAAKAIGGDVHVLVAGAGCGAAAEAAAKLDGASKVLVADAPQLANQLAEELAPLIVGARRQLRRDPRAGDRLGQERAAARRRRARRARRSRTSSRSSRPTRSSGRSMPATPSRRCSPRDAKKVITVRTASFQAVGDGGSAPIEKIAAPAAAGISTFDKAELSKSDRPELTSARIIISGGRGMQSGENFKKYIEPVADKLGAAMGASRAAVDAGFVPNDFQVGQTGKVVAPELYIAVGISGAIQHLAGMKDSKVIVAINKDAEAPIFQVADYGLVADLFTGAARTRGRAREDRPLIRHT